MIPCIQKLKRNKNVCLFIAFLLLAGLANLFSRTGIPAIDTLMTFINYVIYLGLLLFWIESVRTRLLPSGARSFILQAGSLMLLYMLIRIFRYRFALSNVAKVYAVYAYWVPQLLIPALFLMTCIRIRHGGKEPQNHRDRLILIPGAILSLIVMTNNLHFLVYIPQVDLSQFAVITGTYTYGPVFWLLYAWMFFTALAGLIILFREVGHLQARVIRLLLCLVLVWAGLVLLALLVFDNYTDYRLFNIPEISIFCMLGVIEVCIRYRLIPYNENYTGFFGKLQIPSVITDLQLHIAYRSGTAIATDENNLREALSEPVALTPDLKLYSKEIRAGYAFWVEDESAIHQAQERLLEANEMIEHENDLLRAETEQKEKEAYLASRHRIYHEIAQQLHPCQKRIGQVLDQATPGSYDFREQIAYVSVLNAYVKRKTNLLLLAAENDTLPVTELYLALQESAYYLTLAGLQTTALEPKNTQYPAEKIIFLYDAFESIAEQLLGNASALMVSWNKKNLRLAAETESSPLTEGIRLPVQSMRSENVLYIDLCVAETGGEAK